MKLTFIVPMYNSSNTINETLQSIPDDDNCEIIVVDDGSTEKYQLIKKSNLILLKQDNAGPQSAINRGIKAAKGEYITFVDSDDSLSSNYLSVIMKYINLHKYDIISFSYIDKYKSRSYLNKLEASGEYTGEMLTYLKNNYLVKDGFRFSNMLSPARWNKVFKRELLLANIDYFDENFRLGEDILMTTICVLQSKSIKVINDEFLYTYYHYDGSLSKEISIDHWVKYRLLIDKLKYFYELNELDSCKLDAMYVYFAKAILKNNITKIKYKDYKSITNNIFITSEIFNGLKMINSKTLGIKDKVYYYLIKFRKPFLIYHLLRFNERRK